MDNTLTTGRETPSQNISAIFTPFSNMKLVSLISWLLLAVTSLVSLVKPQIQSQEEYNLVFSLFHMIWATFSYNLNEFKTTYYPALMFGSFYNFCFYSLQ